ncbi:hypothetical protein DRO61_07350, partial [Candidatus Bathyarchaeota archaeon]
MNLIRKAKTTKNNLSAQWQNILIKTSLNLDKPLNKPTSVIFDLTPNCVLRCKQCDIWKNPPVKHLSYQKSKVLIDKIHSWLGESYVFFTGGEPLMNQDLPKIIKYAHKKGILSHINSAATLINDKVAQKLLDNHLFAISISLDGSIPKTHDYLRGRTGTYNRAVQAIEHLQKLPSSKKPKIYINTVMMKDNVKELEELIKFASQQKTDGISFQCLLPNLGSKNSQLSPVTNPLWPETGEMVETIKRIMKLSKSNKIVLTSPDDLNLAIQYYKDPHVLDSMTCAAGINNFIIDHLGDVRLCFEYSPIGNLFKESPAKIWWSKKSQKQR